MKDETEQPTQETFRGEMTPELARKLLIGAMSRNENAVAFGVSPNDPAWVLVICSGPVVNLAMDEAQKVYEALGRVLAKAKEYQSKS